MKRACKRIWLIVELFHRTVDPLSCFFADISVVVDDARNGRFGNAGFLATSVSFGRIKIVLSLGDSDALHFPESSAIFDVRLRFDRN